jgi:hypothetical protein
MSTKKDERKEAAASADDAAAYKVTAFGRQKRRGPGVRSVAGLAVLAVPFVYLFRKFRRPTAPPGRGRNRPPGPSP